VTQSMPAVSVSGPRSVDAFEAIQRLKVARNAVILAHYYQDPDVQDVADFIGDSLALAQAAERTKADVIVFAGVHFMAETAKIVNPNKVVVIPDVNAGCSLADACPASELQKLKARHPEARVVSYINCSAEVKALSDIICTSSNAIKVIESIPAHEPIIFAPDKNLGQWLIKQTGRDMILWQGSCIVHETFSSRKLRDLKAQYPDATVLAHPECEAHILEDADIIGSTLALLNHVKQNPYGAFIVVTEAGIMHQMHKEAPQAQLIAAPPEGACACNECPFMRLNTLEKIQSALETLTPAIEMPEALRQAAWLPLERMLAISRPTV